MNLPGRVYLRAPELADQEEFISLMHASRAFHRPWASAPADEERFLAYLLDAQRNDFDAMLLQHVARTRQDRRATS